ncbi:MAG: carboxypeptidase-like regulatory domain-containing protein [Gemmatimonadaceae bacterium]
MRPESPDLLIAYTLGWPDAIPGATVVLRRESGANVTAQSDTLGVVTFADLVEGNYQLTASRTFTTIELGRLSPADRDYSAWGGARTVSLGNSGGVLPFEITVAAARRGSIVFSEILSGGFITFQPDGSKYDYSGYLELFNNSDTTITLDGMLLASTSSPLRDYGGTFCALGRDLYADTAGVWADIIYQLPPIGRRLRPGEFVIVASDGIDHRSFGARDVYDLSTADYELYMGPGDVDNPSVPNLISVGTAQSHSAYTTHGTYWLELSNALVVALPQDVSALPRRLKAAQNHDYLLLSRTTLLDVFTWFVDDPRFPPLCAPAVGVNIDAAPFVMSAWVLTNTSFQKARLPGSSHLMRSRSSARDYAIVSATPFSIP